MIKDIPIIFSGPMVRALLDGRKTMTRRIVKNVPEPPAMDAIYPGNEPKHPVPYLDAYCSERATHQNPRGMSRRWCWWTRDDRQCLPTVNVRYAPGDRLWVRENHAFVGGGDPGLLLCAADWRETAARHRCENAGTPPKWTPSIHMPRSASRLTLIVTGVKVERLQDMSPEDAIAEGMKGITKDGKMVKYGLPDSDGLPGNDDFGWHWHEWRISPVDALEKLWRSINGDDAWTANPYVVALTFTVHKQNIDTLPKADAA